jgi:hypothetical protein
MVYITHIRMSSGGQRHEHITDVKWRDPSDGDTNQSSRQQMVDWINKGNTARVKDSYGNDINVMVVNASPPYIRTYADGVPTDNLLALPRF